MTKRWQMPGTDQEEPGPLAAFGFDAVPATRVTAVDPPVSERQRRYMGAALGRKRRGESLPSDPEMSEKKIREYARKPRR